MEDIIRSRITKRVACAVLVRDDLTGRLLTGPDVKVSVPGRPDCKPVRKSDGYFVLIEEGAPIRSIRATAGRYQETITDVDPARLNPLSPVVWIRLTPRKEFGIPEGMAGLEGLAEPGSLVTVFQAEGPGSRKLLEDYTPSQPEPCMIRLYGSQRSGDMEGRIFAIRERGTDEEEIFRIAEVVDEERGIYHMEAPLKKNYSRAGSEVAAAYRQRVDGDGHFYLLLSEISPESPVRVISTQEAGQRRRTLIPAIGRISYLDLNREEEA